MACADPGENVLERFAAIMPRLAMTDYAYYGLWAAGCISSSVIKARVPSLPPAVTPSAPDQ